MTVPKSASDTIGGYDASPTQLLSVSQQTAESGAAGSGVSGGTTSTTQAHSGTQSWKQTLVSGANSLINSAVTVFPGEVLRYEGWFYGPRATKFYVFADYSNAANGYVSGDYSHTVTPAANTWTHFSVTFTVPAGIKTATTYIQTATADGYVAGDIVYLDDQSLASVNGVSLAMSLADTAVGTETAPVQILSPLQQTAESGAAGAGVANATTSNTQAHSGTQSWSRTLTSSGNNLYDLQLPTSPGNVYTFTGWVYGPRASTNFLIYCDWALPGQVYAGGDYSHTVSGPANTWIPFSATFTIPAGMAFFSPSVQFNISDGWVVGDVVYLDDQSVVPVTTVNLAVSESTSETGASTSSASTTATQATNETGTGANAASVAAIAPGAIDGGSGADSGSVAAVMSSSDAGTGGEATALAVNVAVSDVGGFTDAASVPNATLSAADSGTNGSTVSITATVPASDSVSGSDGAWVFDSNAATDGGAGVDLASLVVSVTASDAGSGADVVTSSTVSILVTETGHAVENTTTGVPVAASDVIASAEAVSIAIASNAFDAGSAVDAGQVTAAMAVADSGALADATGTLSNTRALSANDSVVSVEAATTGATSSATDAGAATEGVDLDELTHGVLASDSGSGVDSAALGLQSSDVGLVDDSQVSIGITFDLDTADFGALVESANVTMLVVGITAGDSGQLDDEYLSNAATLTADDPAHGVSAALRQTIAIVQKSAADSGHAAFSVSVVKPSKVTYPGRTRAILGSNRSTSTQASSRSRVLVGASRTRST